MAKTNQSTQRRLRRKTGIRKRIVGTPDRPRLTIFRSGKHIYAQVIDDLSGKTLAAANSVQAKSANGGNLQAAKAIGTKIGEVASAAGVKQVAFDRNGYRYHGRIKALADAAREAGLSF